MSGVSKDTWNCSTGESNGRGNPVVAFYELFNEPTDYNGRLGRMSWSQYKEFIEEIIHIIYAHDETVIPLVGGFDWAYNLRHIKENPIDFPGVAYVTHPYPQKREPPWEEKWEGDFGFVADTYPVFATEFGFMSEDGPRVHTFPSSVMRRTWNFTPTRQGRFFKEKMMEPNKSLHLLMTVFMLTLALSGCVTSNEERKTVKPRDNWPIITRVGDKLMEGDREFRFMGFAAPNIQQNESQLRADMKNRFPNEFEIRDILGALEWVGSRATRTFSLSVYSPEDELPVYIPARRTYNEEAFRCLDLVIALAHEYDVRLIIPFIASQQFIGIRGVDEFSDLAGKPRGSFWTDEEVKDDFKHFLDFILNRRNTVNGLLYKEDPTILAWQLGNEFGSYGPDRGLPYEDWEQPILDWSLEMAAYIKSIDPNHLVMEAGGADRQAFIDDPNIDIISEHLYEYWNKISGRP